MKSYLQKDGFPLTFNLIHAARFTETSVPTLRNYIAREHLHHAGQLPLAGQERRFTVTGLIEIAIITELTNAGYPVGIASLVADSMLNLAGELALKAGRGKEYRGKMRVNLDQNPDQWMIGPWADRDLENPQIALFFIRFGSEVLVGDVFAKGWGDIENAQRKSFRAISSDQVTAWSAFNLTALLCKIDAAIDAFGIREVVEQALVK